MFNLTLGPIENHRECSGFDNLASGGFVFFQGCVRNHNDGHRVKSLEYQCYESMAIKEGKKIVKTAFRRFDIHFAKCIHRYGHLELGDVAVWVGASAFHRRDAFEACRYIIDHVKSFVPIWKKEHYVDKPSQWVACHTCGTSHE